MGLILRNNTIVKNLRVGPLSGGGNGGGGGSSEPSYLAVGAYGYNSSQGAVYLYDATDFTSSPTKLIASDGSSGAAFGDQVAINGNTLAVGAWLDQSFSGAVYVYDIDNLSASPTKLTTNTGDQFGKSVAVTNNYIIGGAPNDDNDANNAGSVHVFDKNNLSANPTVLSSPSPGVDYNFGTALAASETYLVVSEHDINNYHDYYLYVYDITNLSAPPTQVGPFLMKGSNAVSIQGDTLIVGAPGESSNQGRVYVYNMLNLSASPTVLVAPDAANNDEFGESVDISSDHIIVGSRYNDDDGGNSGAAYVYDRSNLSASPTKLREPLGNAGASKTFGKQVSATGSIITVSSNGPASSSTNGAVYVYDANDLTATPTLLSPNDLGQYHYFGEFTSLG